MKNLVHVGITIFLPLALIATWKDLKVRHMLLLGLASYVVMRVWSGVFFIPEMLAFQQVPLESPPSAELTARVDRWTSFDLVAGTARCAFVPVLPAGPLLAEEARRHGCHAMIVDGTG